ncbi:unnamed protein product [Cuscuta epithymum]|uniref:Uncharacterized protein n=1 Tax=Cuscuta epithymum TaxID=186058 RepID=A0AAV0EW89_9ASTE|nr:unnamed protein product [Cuscuta epithymum]
MADAFAAFTRTQSSKASSVLPPPNVSRLASTARISLTPAEVWSTPSC